jgi:hypothetical protein
MSSITIHSLANIDASTQIQNAINSLGVAGGTLIISPGTYDMSKAVIVNNTANLTIKGNGATLIALPAMPMDSNGCFFMFQGCSALIISGLSFNGNAINRGPIAAAPQGILLNWTNNVQIIGCNFMNSVCDDIFMWGGLNPTALSLACHNIRITGCSFENPARNAISVVNGVYVRIDHNRFNNIRANAPMAAVDIEPNYGDLNGITHHVTMDNNTVTNCFHGMVCWNIAAPFEMHYDGNNFDGVDYPIENQAPASTIAWNHISNSKAFPICTGSGSVAQIYSNRIYKCPQWAIGPTDILGDNVVVH